MLCTAAATEAKWHCTGKVHNTACADQFPGHLGVPFAPSEKNNNNMFLEHMCQPEQQPRPVLLAMPSFLFSSLAEIECSILCKTMHCKVVCIVYARCGIVVVEFGSPGCKTQRTEHLVLHIKI